MNTVVESAFQVMRGIKPEWWHILAIMLVPVLYFAIRAVAVILIGRWVKPDIAKLALPLLLCPKRKNNEL